MKWPATAYRRASSLDDVWAAFAAHGPGVQLLAGGQTLLATLAFRLSEPGLLLDITRIPALRGIALHGATLRIGALTRHAELGRDPLVRQHAPLLHDAVPHIAHPAIRNRGTIGGSLAYADPAAELPACAVALGATLVLASARGERRVAAEDFFTGLFTTALAPDELIAAIEVPIGQGGSIAEIARRSGDYAMCGLALVGARPVFFGVGPGPVLAREAGAALARGDVEAACAALDADLDPPADLHGPPAMKRHLARVLLRRAMGARTGMAA